MTTKPKVATPAAKKKLLSRIAASQRQADAAKKTAKSAKLGFKNARQKFKDAKRTAKKSRKAVKALKLELAALSAKKPAHTAAKKPKTKRSASAVAGPETVEVSTAPVEATTPVEGAPSLQ